MNFVVASVRYNENCHVIHTSAAKLTLIASATELDCR